MAGARRTEFRIVELDGSTAAVHVRWDAPDGAKRFVWEQPDGTVGLCGRPIAALPLYALTRLTQSTTDVPVFLVEGEKAADALASVGIVALGTVTGAAATPGASVLSVLAGRDVRLWPDNDDVGRAHMLRIARLLNGVARSIGIVEWTDAPDGGDAADFMDAGATHAAALALPIVSADLSLEAAADGNVTRHIRSAGHSIPKVAEANLPFQTAREFAASSPAEVLWVAKPYIAAGAITGVDGKIKAAGKTTLVTHLCRAVLDGLPFLGTSTHRTGVVYLTEQPPSSFREALRRADLLDRDDFVLLSWRDASRTAWADVLAAAVAEAAYRAAGLLVVDTLSRFAGIHGDGENNAGEAEAAMAPLQLAAADGLAVVVVRHERKAGGEVGDSGRGSTAFGGAADIVMAVRRTSGDSTTARNTREIHALSRFDETPDLLIVELTESGYRAIGDRAVAVHEDAKATILGIVSSSSGLGLTIDQVVEQSKHGRTTTQDVLEELAAEGIVTKDGRGVRGDPYRYRASTTDAIETDPSAPRPRDAMQLADLLRHAGGDMESIGDFHD